MYDSFVVSEKLKTLKPFVEFGGRLHPFKLEEHSISECENAVQFLNDLIDIDAYESSKAKSKDKVEICFKGRSFDLEESIFIQNEILMCRWDANYWTDRYYIISNTENKMQRFSPLKANEIWRRIEARQNRKKLAIRTLDLKARQVGKTTHGMGRIQQRIQFHDDVNSLLASKDSTASWKMVNMIVNSMNLQPYWLRPLLRTYENGEFYHYDNNSLVDVGYGTQKALGRGTTPTVSHLSEIASFKYPIDSIESALIRAMHESEWLLQMFEGTAEKRDDWFHSKVKETIKGMQDGSSSLYFCFVPWFVRDDIYPTETWLRARSDYFERWEPSKEVLAHAKKAESYVKSNPDINCVLGSNWYMTKEQMFYYELEKTAAKNEDRLAKFLQEMPADPEEAFQNAGRSIFSVETTIRLADEAQEKIPKVYKLRGDDIPSEYWPEVDELDDTHETIVVKYKGLDDIPAFFFEFVRVKFDGWDKFNANLKILIWEQPNPSFDYGISVDPAEGLGEKLSDDAAIEVVRKGTMEYNDKQVCEFISPDIPQGMLWPWIMAISALFSAQGTKPDVQALLIIENNAGKQVIQDMVNRGWFNFYTQIEDAGARSRTTPNQIGLNTNRGNRDYLMNHLISFIKGFWVNIYSMALIAELKDLQKKTTISAVMGSENNKILGKRDNRVLAIAFALYCLHINEIRDIEKKTWDARKQREDNLDVIYLKGFEGYSFEKDDPDELGDYIPSSSLDEGDYENYEDGFSDSEDYLSKF